MLYGEDRERSGMLRISDRQIDALRAALDEGYVSQLIDYLKRAHPDRSRALGGSRLATLAERLVVEARRLGVEDGRVIARLATVALLVDADVLHRPEVKALFAFSGLGADLKADLLCDQIGGELAAAADPFT
jgi:hypothetical protein